jgi:hypothetical protein
MLAGGSVRKRFNRLIRAKLKVKGNSSKQPGQITHEPKPFANQTTFLMQTSPGGPSIPIASPIPHPLREPIAPRPWKRSKSRILSWEWSLLFLVTSCIFGGVGVLAFFWLASLPPLPNCQEISPLSADMERLYCAREAARSGKADDLLKGLKLVEGWSTTRPLYGEAHQLLEEWSQDLFIIARAQLEASGLQTAVTIASQIPEHSSVYQQAQTAIADWQKEWKTGDAIYATAQAALKQQNWRQASAQIPALAQLNNSYWRKERTTELTEAILAERAARQTLNQARQLANRKNLQNIGQAIALAIEIDPQTYAWTDAKTNLQQWSQVLITQSMSQWKQGDVTGAVSLAQMIPPELEVAPQAKDLIWFSHAEQLATVNTTSLDASLQRIWNLMEALSAIRRIQPGSQFYAIAQSRSQTWQQQLQDLTQLQFAKLTASLGQRPAYELAIQQAQLVNADHPQGVQAQSLIADWHEQIERIEDQPYLLYARRLADTGTVPALQKAIAFARQIPLGRALRIDAQTAIATWLQQIEIVEDKPIFDQAQALAKQGKLSEAIDVAAKIRVNRALYAQAQAAIANWHNQIEAAMIAEDQRILDQAGAEAAEERLTIAIDIASQIAPGRPLYNEAQSAISQWESQRSDIWQNWADRDQQPDQSGDQPADQSGDTGDSSGDSSAQNN